MTVQHFDLPIDAETFLAARGDILRRFFPTRLQSRVQSHCDASSSGFSHGIATS